MAIINRNTTRETAAEVRELGQNRNVIVTVTPSGAVGFRLKGLRSTEWLDAAALWQMAVKCRIQDEKNQKRRSKKK